MAFLKTIRAELEDKVKTIQDAVDEVKSVQTADAARHEKLVINFKAVLDAINRLEQKIVAGADAQPIIDALAPIKQSIADEVVEIETKTAEANLTGV